MLSTPCTDRFLVQLPVHLPHFLFDDRVESIDVRSSAAHGCALLPISPFLAEIDPSPPVTAVLNLNSALLGATITSNSIPLWIVANPSALGEPLHPTDLYFQHEHEDLGVRLSLIRFPTMSPYSDALVLLLQIVSASVSSPNFSVSALCKISLTLLCPAHDFKLVSFSAFLTQSFDLRYDDGFSTRTPSQILRLIDVDSTPSSSLQSSSTLSSNDLLTTCSSLPEPESTEQVSTHAFVPVDVPAGSHFTHSRLCRIPSDKLVRPTTLPGTDTPLRISHTCSIRVRFRENGDKEDRVIEIAKPVVVASWCVPLSPAPSSLLASATLSSTCRRS